MTKQSLLGLIAALALGGCSGSGSGTPGSGGGGAGVFGAQGSIAAPADGTLAVVWIVSTGSPDIAYSFGTATAAGSTFSVSFSSEPPEQALNSDGIGIGFVGLFAPGTQVSEGILPDGAGDQLIGFTARHAIIYKKPGASVLRWWSGNFSDGYACGVCLPPPAGETFDGYEPVDCSSLELVSAETDACNWT